jgi:hypothetical protein
LLETATLDNHTMLLSTRDPREARHVPRYTHISRCAGDEQITIRHGILICPLIDGAATIIAETPVAR